MGFRGIGINSNMNNFETVTWVKTLDLPQNYAWNPPSFEPESASPSPQIGHPMLIKQRMQSIAFVAS